jgi:hypothetical protein
LAFIRLLEEREVKRAHERVIKELEEDLYPDIEEEAGKIVIQEHQIKDELGLVTGEPGEIYRYTELIDVESSHEEVNKQKKDLALGEGDKSGRVFTFVRIEDGQFIYRSDDDKKQEIALSARQLPLSENTRGKAIALEYFQQVDPKTLHKTYLRAKEVSKRDDRPLSEVMRQMCKQKLLSFEQKQRKNLGRQIIHLDKEIEKFTKAVGEVTKKINEQLQKLGKMSKAMQEQPKFRWLKNSMLQKKEQGEQRLNEYLGLQKNFQDRMKLALHDQYPHLHLRELTSGEVNQLYLAATEVKKGGVEELRNHLERNKDEKGLKALDKAEQPFRNQEKEVDIQRK